ncbi:MAG: outer membrane protein [Hyphomonadaceae bacterium]|nr:MAG: outer membrane protein [Hyphomonadaceae bacterium]
MKKFYVATIAMAILASTSALAQTVATQPAARPTAPAATVPRPAPAVASTPAAPRPATAAAPTVQPSAPAVTSNVVIVNMEYVLRMSDAGRDMSTKLQNIARAMSAELQPEATAIDAERTRLLATPASQLQTPQYAQQEEALGRRMQLFEQKRQYAAAELQATREAALDKFQTAISPVVQALVTSRNALLVLDASTVTYYVPGVDATGDLTIRLNAVVRTIDVVRTQPRDEAGAIVPRPGTAAPAAAPAAGAPLPRQPAAAPAPRP